MQVVVVRGYEIAQLDDIIEQHHLVDHVGEQEENAGQVELAELTQLTDALFGLVLARRLVSLDTGEARLLGHG